jgi:hypothetical protein
MWAVRGPPQLVRALLSPQLVIPNNLLSLVVVVLSFLRSLEVTKPVDLCPGVSQFIFPCG